MAYAQPTTITTGDIVTATYLNQLRDNWKALADPWTTYIPVLTATTTNPSGPSTKGAYIKVGRFVWGWLKVTWMGIGSGASAGAGVYFFSLPVATSINYAAYDSLGIAVYQDTGSRQYVGSADWQNSTHVSISLEGGVQVANSSPVAAANGDFYYCHFFYEASS